MHDTKRGMILQSTGATPDEVKAANAFRGKANRAAGLQFEELIKRACEYYRENGIAYITKTPEPMRIISRGEKNGTFKAIFASKSECDFHGTMKGGQSIYFEAKYTDKGQIEQSAVKRGTEKDQAQWECLEASNNLYADCFVIVAFGLDNVYRIPWIVWANMEGFFGRRHIKETDEKLDAVRVKIKHGVLDFLGALK